MTAKKNFPLRIDPKLFQIIEGWAADEFRSVNSHIEYLLRESVKKAGRLPRKMSAEGVETEEN
ncbi:MAG: toxin-antitoxin system HicB family antitoxin [Peptococcaceae bacterium]|nr:toxin-antitoxin system HicB family antitoxin [Peptococcaceae bacterium]